MFEAQSMSTIFDKILIDSGDFDEYFETTFITPSEILGRDSVSIRNIKFRFRNDSSIEPLIDLVGNNIDAELASCRSITFKSISEVPTNQFPSSFYSSSSPFF